MLIVSNVMSKTIKNTTGGMFILYAKLCSQLCINHHDSGNAISNDISISFIKSFESIVVMVVVDAPVTLRIPISFLLFCAVNAGSDVPHSVLKLFTGFATAAFID